MLPFMRPGRAASVANNAAPEDHVSRALPGVLNGLPARDEATVLDMGAAWGESLVFWSERTRRLVVGDLWEGLMREPGPRPDPARVAKAATEAIQGLDGRAPSLVLLWDLLHHPDREEVAALAGVLAGVAGPATRLFAIVAGRGQMPAVPRLHRLVGIDRLRLDPAVLRVPPPMRKEPELCRLLAGFRVESTYLLRSGDQEYVFRWDPPGAAAALANLRAARSRADLPHTPAPPVVTPPSAPRNWAVSVPRAYRGEPKPVAAPSATDAPLRPRIGPSSVPAQMRADFAPKRRIELPRRRTRSCPGSKRPGQRSRRMTTTVWSSAGVMPPVNSATGVRTSSTRLAADASRRAPRQAAKRSTPSSSPSGLRASVMPSV